MVRGVTLDLRQRRQVGITRYFTSTIDRCSKGQENLMVFIFLDGPCTILVPDGVAGATGCAADGFPSVAEIEYLIHGMLMMYRRSWDGGVGCRKTLLD
jgi:hypothetical protein